MRIKRNEKGFTLAELLIVVAIIAVLVAIGIPIFSSQLEKSRESTDLANVRSAYAEVMAAAISGDKTIDFDKDGNSNYSDTDGWFYPVSLKQKKEGWSSATPITVGGVTSGTDGGDNADGTWKGYPKADGKCTIYFSNDAIVKFVWDGASGARVVDWSTQPLQNAGQKMIASLKSKPGTNSYVLYSDNYSDFTDDEKRIVSEIKKYINLDNDKYAIYYDWTGYPGIRCTVTTSVSKEGQEGPFEYVKRISFNKDGKVIKVVKEYGAWQYANNRWGFYANDTVKGVKYPSETLYELKQ